MLRPLLVVPLLISALAAAWLARGALLRWRDLRAAQTYELTAEQRPMLLRAGGAVLCGMCVTALAVALLLSGRSVRGVADEALATAGPRPAAPPAESPGATPGLLPVVTRFESVGHPAGGNLLEAVVAAPDGRPRKVRVWLPAEYLKDPKAAFPVIVLHSGTAGRTADSELPDVFEGVASAVQLGKARPFVVVAPEAPNGTGHPCDLIAAAPQAVADDTVLRTAVNENFRTAPAGPGGWAVLGVEGGAPCAAAAGLARPDLYGAAAAVSGRYDAPALTEAGAEIPGTAPARLLLAAAKKDTEGLAAARKLQSTLHGGKGRAAKADVRISDIVEDFAPDRERLRLVRVAVQYLAETLAKPA
ncbi:alpha/beta hydrolase-fold protein [Kitasatospora sp. NPDC048540]|uniref:alpha/beta hydrolase-fold protein n=1 Tax=unclassified Kitasatospora TaxID=2633591 RepID=UPI0005397D24|nr:alpha/beta hydrolase-fold protein [Kitasatospora sp. MBT63]